MHDPLPAASRSAAAGAPDENLGSQPDAGKDEFKSGQSGTKPRLLVVSHPAVLGVNQVVYRELRRRGFTVTIVVPSRWRHSYSSSDIGPEALAGMEPALVALPVALPGRPQRYFHTSGVRRTLAAAQPDVAFLEAEPFALVAGQWGRALHSRRVPFGVQVYENIDRALPPPVRWMRGRVLRDATFVAARSDTAGRLARAWGARGEIGLAPPAVPRWEPEPRPGGDRPFTIGYAGRLIESKGLLDLLAAARALEAPVELLLFGDGELRERLDGQPIPGSHVQVRAGLAHEQMPSAYAQLDVLVLPSHTTATWKEQFGRVLVEALWCGVPVVGSDSGEIPWVIGLTEGGLLFPEGDVAALAQRLNELRAAPELRAELARRGRDAVERLFSVPAAADSLEALLTAGATRRTGP